MSINDQNPHQIYELRAELDQHLLDLQRHEESLPKMDEISSDVVRQIAQDELHQNDNATRYAIDKNGQNPLWIDLGFASNKLYARRPKAFTDEQEAELDTLRNDATIIYGALGSESNAYKQAQAAIDAKSAELTASLAPSQAELDLEEMFEAVGQAVPILAIKGISERIATKAEEAVTTLVEDDQDTTEAELAATEEAVQDTTLETIESNRKKEQLKRGSVATIIVDFVTALGGKATDAQIMKHLDSLIEDPDTNYGSTSRDRFRAHMQMLAAQSDKLGISIELQRPEKRNQPYVLTIKESEEVKEAKIHAIQAAYDTYATLRTERDGQVQGTLSVAMLSEAILGILKDPRAWSRGKDDDYWPNQADQSALIGFITEACDDFPVELSLEDRRAYAAAIVSQKIHQDPKWIENEFNIYEKANSSGEYNPIQNALAIMLKLQDMSVAERGDFMERQLNAHPYIRIGAEVSKKVSVITDVSNLPLRNKVPQYVADGPEADDTQEIPLVTPLADDVYEAETEEAPELEIPDIVQAAVASQVEVEPVVEAPVKAEAKKKSIFGKEKLTAEQRAYKRLIDDGIQDTIGKAIEIIESKGLMSPEKEGTYTGSKAQALIKATSDKFLTQESVRRVSEAGFTSRNFNRDEIISREDVILHMIFNNHQRLLGGRPARNAFRQIIRECIASYDSAYKPAVVSAK